MRPTVGRIVLYRPTNEVVWAALITEVRSDVDVDLTVFPSSRPVMHKQHVTQGDKTSQWSWPVIEAPVVALVPDTESEEDAA